MTIGLAFWILMLIWLVWGFWSNWPSAGGTPNYQFVGGNLLLFVLLALLGWHDFGAPIHG
jgi:hypothetical protein